VPNEHIVTTTLLSGLTYTGQTAAIKVVAGDYNVAEVASNEWAVTASACGPTGGPQPTNVGTQSLSTTVPIGGSITCGFENTTKTTRTQGYWATHFSFTQAISSQLTGTDAVWCSPPVTTTTTWTKSISTLSVVEGSFWSSIPNKTVGGKRSAADQARMQLAQQLAAAILNVKGFSLAEPAAIAAGKAAFCGDDSAANQTAMKNAQGLLGIFNALGDGNPTALGMYPADPKTAKTAADLASWNNPKTLAP